jgi:hypothetical protein
MRARVTPSQLHSPRPGTAAPQAAGASDQGQRAPRHKAPYRHPSTLSSPSAPCPPKPTPQLPAPSSGPALRAALRRPALRLVS